MWAARKTSNWLPKFWTKGVFDPSPTPRVFALPPGVDFSACVLDGLMARVTSQTQQAQTQLLVNTRRMARQVQTLLQAKGAQLHPRIGLVTELNDLPGPFDQTRIDSKFSARMALFPLVQGLLQAKPHLAPKSAAFDLADSLATLFEEMAGEGVAAADLRTIDLSNFSDHWALAQEFIDIAARAFEGQEIVLSERAIRDAVLHRTAHWQENPPSHPIIIAGSTGSRGTTFELMKAVATLPNGAVILPGFDRTLPDTVWELLTEGNGRQDHPQYRFAKFLHALNLTKDDVQTWIDVPPPHPARQRLIGLALRPAPTTDQWLVEGPGLDDLDDACAGITWLEAADQRAEAETIALRLRAAVEDGLTAAVISPDRTLTRQIATNLGRWNIRADDSAGVPLSLTAPGRLVLQLLGIWMDGITPEAVIPLLKHPLVHAGSDRGQHLKHTRELELAVRTGSVVHFGDTALDAWQAEDDRRGAWVSWFMPLLATPYSDETAQLADWVTHIETVAEQLGCGVSADTSALWEKEPGRETLRCFQQIKDASADSVAVGLDDFSTIFRSVLGAADARDREDPNAPIVILGTLEARVQSADLVVLAGLNDGTWPEIPTLDNWLNRTMRTKVNLLLPDRQVGLAAHDFQQAVSSQLVWVTRSKRSAETETIPSRWLNRLENLLSGLDQGRPALAAMKNRAAPWVAAAKALHDAPPADRYKRPAPKPPATARPRRLSVTEIKTLIRDPYSIYAKHVLQLPSLDPLGLPPTAATRGIVFHSALEAFFANADTVLDAEVLRQTFAQHVESTISDALTRKFWLHRAASICDWVVGIETDEKEPPAARMLEAFGELLIPNLDFTLVGKADRIDISPTGWGRIIDYKTGRAPTPAQQKSFDKQLPLLIEMAARGAFKKVQVKGITDAAFLELVDPGRVVPSTPTDDSFWPDFVGLIERYCDGSMPFYARRAMPLSDIASPYDQLARFGEWDLSRNADPDPIGGGKDA